MKASTNFVNYDFKTILSKQFLLEMLGEFELCALNARIKVVFDDGVR